MVIYGGAGVTHRANARHKYNEVQLNYAKTHSSAGVRIATFEGASELPTRSARQQ